MGEESKRIPILGGIAVMGEYYIQVFFHEPGHTTQKLRLQVDTGSSSLLVAGAGCTNCTSRVKRAPYEWNENRVVNCSSPLCSAQFCDTATGGGMRTLNACGFRLKYGDDTPQYSLEATGVVTQASIQLENSLDESRSKQVYAYVIQREMGNWPTRVDGIFGLAFERLNCNPNCFPLAWKQFETRPDLGFTICLGDVGGSLHFLTKPFSPAAATTTSSIKLRLISGQVFVEKSFYAVKAMGIAIVERDEFLLAFKPSSSDAATAAPRGNLKPTSSSSIPRGQVAVIDTGTTLLILPNDMFANLKRHLQREYCHLPGMCPSSLHGRTIFDFGTCLAHSPHDTFPTLALVFDGNKEVVLIPPALYFIRYGEGVYCLGIQPSGGNEFIVGDALLRGFTLAFDADSVTFSTDRASDCGVVSGLAWSDHQDLILTRGIKLGYLPQLREEESVSLVFFLLVGMFWITVVSLWRILARRQLGYDAL